MLAAPFRLCYPEGEIIETKNMDNDKNNPNNPSVSPQQQVIERLKSANNILVTVSTNPSVDQLAACIGLTIMLNKLKKHATAVFSGAVPSTIEFLKPEDTLEKTTDSLRDFIISLDKSKADKLRYKVEENVVKIFITPYRTSISQNDLEFSQGDFNVDVVLALGVHEQKDLDQAITAHGRILHDAAVASVNVVSGGEIGTINWTDPSASSLSELATQITDGLGKDLIDAQIATALLTGIVAETNRFSNEKTSPNTMRLSAELMTAGANQQLVANELQATTMTENADEEIPRDQPAPPPKGDNGTLEITHPPKSGPKPDQPYSGDRPSASPRESLPDVKPDTTDVKPPEASDLVPSEHPGPHIMTQPPALGGMLTANTEPEDGSASGDVLGVPAHEPDMPLLGHDKPAEAASPPSDIPLPTPVEPVEPLDSSPIPSEPPSMPEPPSPSLGGFQALPTEPLASGSSSTQDSNSGQIHIDADGNMQPSGDQAAAPAPSANTDTLKDLEQSVHSTHLEGDGPAAENKPELDSARNAVMDAINSTPTGNDPLKPKQDVGAAGYLNVQDLPDNADAPASTPPMPSLSTVNEPSGGKTPADTPLDMPLPPSLSLPPANPMPPTSTNSDATPPPPVPPPFNLLSQ